MTEVVVIEDRIEIIDVASQGPRGIEGRAAKQVLIDAGILAPGTTDDEFSVWLSSNSAAAAASAQAASEGATEAAAQRNAAEEAAFAAFQAETSAELALADVEARQSNVATRQADVAEKQGIASAAAETAGQHLIAVQAVRQELEPLADRMSRADLGSLSQWVATGVPAPQVAFTTTSYATSGDGGGATYRRVASEPSHPGKVQIGTAWFEIAERRISPAHFGYVMDGTGDGATALTNAIQAAAATGGEVWAGIKGQVTRIKSAVELIAGTRLRGLGGMILADRVAALTDATLIPDDATDVVLEGVHIRNNAVTGSGRSCLALGANVRGVHIKSGCVFDQDPTDGNTVPGDYECAGIRIQEPGVANVIIDPCRFEWLKYGILISNVFGGHSAAYDTKFIQINGGVFDNIASDGICINSPNDVYDSQSMISIVGPVINVPRGITNVADTKNNQGLGLSVAGATRVSIVGPVIRARRQAIHVEDEVRELSISGGSLAGMGYYPAVTTIAFVASTPAKITDTAKGFWEEGFRPGDEFAVTGSASNNGTYHIADISDDGGEITLKAGEALVAEAAGASVTLDGTEGVGSFNLIHLVPSSISSVSPAAISQNIAITGVSISHSKGAGIEATYGSTNRNRSFAVTGCAISKCRDVGIRYAANVDASAAITGNPISKCGTAIELRGGGTGTVVDNNPISFCTNGLKFGDHKWGLVVGKNPMIEVVNRYVFDSVTTPVTLGHEYYFYTATQPAGTGQYTPWTDTLLLGEVAKGLLTVTSRDQAVPANYNSQMFDISWNGTTLTITPLGGTAGESMAAYPAAAAALTPQMNGKWLQTRSRRSATGEYAIGITAEFRGQILARSV